MKTLSKIALALTLAGSLSACGSLTDVLNGFAPSAEAGCLILCGDYSDNGNGNSATF